MPAIVQADDGKLEAVFIQVNDVYEIAPLSGGKTGGMARVASLKQKYKQENQNTYLFMAGDFVSPSVYNSLEHDGQKIRGKQMIESMNAAGMDLAIFGNHEFDISETELLNRINESKFDWVSTNTFHKTSGRTEAFSTSKSGVVTAFPETYIMEMRDADGTKVKIGFIGITIPLNKAEYVSYTDPLASAVAAYDKLKNHCDAIVAITHQFIKEDIELAKRLPGLDLIIGGHEHDMRFEKVGKMYITKAHANALSAYVIKIKINKNDKSVTVDPQLVMIDDKIDLDPSTNEVVKKWIDIADKNYGALGFNAKNVLRNSGESFDGRQYEVRRHTTALTDLVAEAMLAASNADIAFYPANLIRVDDILTPPVTEYDVLRTLPLGGPLREVDMKGSLLLKALEAGRTNIGLASFLHFYPAAYESISATWKINKVLLDVAKTYKVVMPETMLNGNDVNLGMLKRDNPEILKIYDGVTDKSKGMSDVRRAIINYLQANK